MYRWVNRWLAQVRCPSPKLQSYLRVSCLGFRVRFVRKGTKRATKTRRRSFTFLSPVSFLYVVRYVLAVCSPALCRGGAEKFNSSSAPGLLPLCGNNRPQLGFRTQGLGQITLRVPGTPFYKPQTLNLSGVHPQA